VAIIRAQVVLPYLSGKPEDVAVNTWHFNASDASQASMDNARTQLVTFYTTVPPNGPSNSQLSAVGAHLTNALNRTANAAKIKMYDLAAGLPRPVTEYSFTLPTSSSPTGKEIPAEVALCLSFYGLRNLPRQRGRLYFGPFHDANMEDDTSFQRSRPTLALREALWSAAKRMAGAVQTVNWAVYSRTSGIAHVVTAGWVDDAWDTQRRRGQDASGRLLWP
jgi:hypothetical protein